ncbi:class I SAM-dependent methyltransferase [Flavobacteriaceae bacterium LMO-SS05]
MNEKTLYLRVKDHSVSGEEFQLLYNKDKELLETFPQPSIEKLPEYYKSENYISHTDSKRNLFERAYHYVKLISLKRKVKLINSFSLDTKNLLDVGCGTGDFLKIAKQNHWSVSGIEPNEKARELANKKTDNSVFRNEQLLKFKPNSFDVITLWHVLEHLPKPEEHMSIFNRLLKPTGTLVIAVPNYKSYDAQHYKNYWAAYDVPRHLWHFSKNAISKLAISNTMTVVKTRPLKFDAYYVCLLSEKYKSGSMNPLKAFWIAFLSNLKAKFNSEYSSSIYIIKNR